MSSGPVTEVVVVVDGVPRPATVLASEGGLTRVRFRDAGGWREETVPTSSLVAVETAKDRPPVLKLVGLGVVALLGVALLLYPSGSDRRLADVVPTPTPTATTSPSASPTPVAVDTVTAVVLGDSFTAGRGNPGGTKTALALATASLEWETTVVAERGASYAKGFFATQVARLRVTPDVLVLQGGASDTTVSEADLTKAAKAVVQAAARRFPDATVVLVGPVAMEQPPDGQLLRVDRVLRAVAAATGAAFVDPIAAHWVTGANHGSYTSATGFYPNAAGHAYLATKLAPALRAALR